MVSIKKVWCIAMLVLVFVCSFGAWSKSKCYSVDMALNQKKLLLSMKALGGHSENCVSCSFKNLCNDSIVVTINPGVVLDNTDAMQQDIVVTKRLKVLLAAHQTKDTVAYGFCCQSCNKSPSRNQPYVLGRTNDSNLIRLCSFIQHHNISEPWIVQSAVWTISNNHSTSSIAESDKAEYKHLIELVRNIKKEAAPTWYYVAYQKVPGVVFSGVVDYVIASFSYRKKTDQELSVVVCDSTGHVVKTLVKNNYAPSGELSFKFKIQLQHWNKGKYKLKVIENKEPSLEKIIDV
jgi:hypothetical protein